MSARAVAAAVVLMTLAGCASHYPQLDSQVLERPEPALTPADRRALAPYLAAPYFRDRS